MLGLFSVHLPLIYGEGKQEALNRLMDEVRRTSWRGSFYNALETEKHQLAKSRTILSLVTSENVFPFSRDPLFVGRKAIIKDVDDQLKRYNAVSLVGLGGIGYEYFVHFITQTAELM